MRLFTGLDLSPEVVSNLENLLDLLRPTARIKWSPPRNLHITTKFIGHWPDERLDELTSKLAAIAARGPVAIRVRNLGFFPNPRSPRVFWAGIEASPELAALAAATEAALEPLGIAREQRAYHPHLTLARIKEPVPMKALQERIAGLPSVDFGEFTCGRFYLYLSQRSRAGSEYTKISEFPLS